MLTKISSKAAGKVNKPARFITPILLTVIFISQVGLYRSQAASTATDFSVAIASGPASLDSAEAPMYSEDLLVVNQIYDTLVRYEPGGSAPVPGLAQSWTNSSDGLTWTFTLRSGVTFQDGTALDSAAVLFNFQRWWDPAHPQHNSDFEAFNSFFGIKNNPNPPGPDLIASLSNPTPTQFVITLKSPAPILAFLAYPSLGIGSPTAIQAGTINTLPVGSGPFKFSSRVAGDHITLVRYDGYWGTKAVATSLTFKMLPTAASQLAALQSNSVQSAGDISGDSLTAAMTDPALQVLWRPSSMNGYLGLNLSKTPLDNLLVRQAIAHAINKQALFALSSYAPGTQVSTQFLPPRIWGFDSTISDYSYDPTLAKSLLTQAGYSSGISIGLAYSTRPRPYMPDPNSVALAIKTDLAAANITVNLVMFSTADWHTYLNQVAAGDFDMFLVGWGMDYPHPNDFFAYNFCNSQYQAYGPQDTELCTMIWYGLTMDQEIERLDAYKWASQRLHDTLPLVPLVNVRSPLVTQRSISGLVPAILTEDYQSAFVPSANNYMPLLYKP